MKTAILSIALFGAAGATIAAAVPEQSFFLEMARLAVELTPSQIKWFLMLVFGSGLALVGFREYSRWSRAQERAAMRAADAEQIIYLRGAVDTANARARRYAKQSQARLTALKMHGIEDPRLEATGKFITGPNPVFLEALEEDETEEIDHL